MHPDPALAADLRALTSGEHLLVWSFRAVAAERFDCPIVLRQYGDACGGQAAQAHAALRVFAQQMGLVGRRPVTLAPAGCVSLTRDEQLLLAIFAAAQAADRARFDAHLTWLLARPPQGSFYAAARLVGEALAGAGRRLRLVATVTASPSAAVA